jgi:hypothetical protein
MTAPELVRRRSDESGDRPRPSTLENGHGRSMSTLIFDKSVSGDA